MRVHDRSMRWAIVAAVAVVWTGRAGAQPNPKFTHATKDDAAALSKQDKVEWKAAAQAGLIMTTGNSRTTTFAAGLNASRLANRNKFALEAAAAYARSAIFLAVDGNANGTIEATEISRPSQTTTKSWMLKARYDRFLTDADSLYAAAGVAADPPAGKDLVGNLQVGYSRQVYHDAVHLLVAEAGYDFTFEDLAVGDGLAIHSLRAFAGYTGKLSDDTSVDGSVEGLFNLNPLDTVTGEIGSFEDIRVTSKLSLTTKLTTKVSFRFAFESKFDNAPAPRAPFAIPYAAGFFPLADDVDTKAEASLIVSFL